MPSSIPHNWVRRWRLQKVTEGQLVDTGDMADVMVAHDRSLGDVAKIPHELEAKAAMIDGNVAAILAYDTKNRLVYCNQAGLRLCGAEDLAELQGSEFPQIRTLGSNSALPLSAALSRGTFFEEMFIEVKPAKVLPCLVHSNQIYNTSGDLTLSYASILDATETHGYKVRLEAKNRELTSAKLNAELSSRSKSEFLANMSHELRTPLNAIIGFAEIIENEILGPCEAYKEYASDIRSSGRHLLAIINDILDVSKIESGLLEVHEEQIDVGEVIESVVMMVRSRAQGGAVKLELDVPVELPALSADIRKLKQILLNLLSNAIKFTAPEGTVTVRAWCGTDSGHVFQIKDTGIGIALDDIPRVLTPFQQVSGELNRKHEGTGLGLPLAKALAELHGGSLDLKSRLGVGTTVTVQLPNSRVVLSELRSDA